MAKAFLLLVICWVNWIVCPYLYAQTVVSESPYRFKHFDTKDGLASEFVYSFAQDSLGFLWIQYSGGLSRYDGAFRKIIRCAINRCGRPYGPLK